MASYNFPTLNLSSALNAKTALVDSNTPALELNLLTRTGLSFDFTGATWDSAGLFPLYDSALEGSLLGVKGANQYSDNTLYITGKEYYALQSINTPTAAAELNGSNKAFFAGGSVPGGVNTTNIESFPFANDTSISSYGALTTDCRGAPGASSGENSYTIQGRRDPSPTPGIYVTAIQKWPNTSGTPVTSTSIAVTGGSYTHSSQPTKIYGQVFFGGAGTYSPWQYLNYSNDTVVDTNFTYPTAPAPAPGRVQLTVCENSSLEFGYSMGSSLTWKIPYANHIPVVTAGPAPLESVFLPISPSIDAFTIPNQAIGVSDTISGHGYQAGGGPLGATVSTISRFPFSTEVLETNIGNLSVAITGPTNGSQGETNGYAVFGFSPSSISTIEKFPFASSTSGTKIGDPPTGPNTDWYFASGTEY